MRLVIYVPIQFAQNFIVQTIFRLAGVHPEHTFSFITNQADLLGRANSNIEVITIPDLHGNSLLRKVWGSRQVRKRLVALGADIFISFPGRPPFKPLKPALMVLPDLKYLKRRALKNFELIVVADQNTKEVLKQQFPSKRLCIVNRFVDQDFAVFNPDRKLVTQKKYSGGTEYFLCQGPADKHDDFIKVLKSFSHFKKRLQSNFRLLFLSDLGSFFEKEVTTYKYRNDIGFIRTSGKDEPAPLFASAYAIVLPFNASEDLSIALNAMGCGVPLIIGQDSPANEIVKNGDPGRGLSTTNDIGAEMIRLYTNETYRSELIEQGRSIAKAFSPGRSADQLWDAITKALG